MRDIPVSNETPPAPSAVPGVSEEQCIAWLCTLTATLIAEHRWKPSDAAYYHATLAHLYELQRLRAQSAEKVGEAWRCFHCNDSFTDADAAREHFGDSECSSPACKLSPDMAGLVALVREQERELRNFRAEETAAFREFYSLGAKHASELRHEEDRGYARGLDDAKKFPETLGLRPSPREPSADTASPLRDVTEEQKRLREEWFVNAGDPQPLTYEAWLEEQLLSRRLTTAGSGESYIAAITKDELEVVLPALERCAVAVVQRGTMEAFGDAGTLRALATRMQRLAPTPARDGGGE